MAQVPRELVIVGAGGFGREVLDVVEAHNSARPAQRFEVLGVIDDDPNETVRERIAARGYHLLGGVDYVLANHTPTGYILGVGDPAVKRRLASYFDAAGWRAMRVLHPSANVGSLDVIDEGVVVCGGVQISTNTRLGRHVHLNPGAIVGHDAQLGDFVSVNPGAILSGTVTIAPGVIIGAGAVVLQGLTVGAESTVGAAACVTRDVGAARTVVGVPARSTGS